MSVGQGFLVEKACDMRNNGLNVEEIVNWLEENKRKVVHSILIDDLNHLKREDVFQVQQQLLEDY